MKTCPACKRTYADETLTFCLVDGSILSAPFDPHETLRISAPQITDPAPTEVLFPAPVPHGLRPPPPSTIQSPQPAPLYPEKQQQSHLKEKQSGKHWMAVGIVMSIVLIFGAGAILSFIWFGNDRPEADNKRPEKLPNTNMRPSPTPTATVEEEVWGMRNDQASLTGERLTYYPGTSPEKCQADCDAYPRCKAYTYIRAGFYNPNDPPMCYLMSVAKDFTASPCCISAVKR